MSVTNEDGPVGLTEVPDEIFEMASRPQQPGFKLGDLGRFPEHGPIEAGGGAHRAEMLAASLDLRKRGFSVDTTVNILEAMLDSGKWLAGTDLTDPFSRSDIERMARGIPAGLPAQGVLEPTPASGDYFLEARGLDYDSEPVREVFVSGLCWRGIFHLYYGAGGIGKTGIAARILAIVSLKGHNVGFINSEDSPGEFVRRFIASGGDLSKLYVFNQYAPPIILPSHVEGVVEDIRKFNLACLLFDSVVDHRDYDMTRGLDAANSARTWAGALQRAALETNCAIIGLAHENKSGTLEGAEMQKNKSRCTAHIFRDGEGINEKTKIEVTKANRGKDKSLYEVTCVEVPSVHPITGATDQEIDENGVAQDASIYVCTDIIKIKQSTGVMAAVVPKHIQVARKHGAEIVAWLQTQDGPRTNAEILAALVGTGVNKNTFSAAASEARLENKKTGNAVLYGLPKN